MPQVVTSENHVEFITTGKVPEFKAPETAEVKDGAKPDQGAGKVVEAKTAGSKTDAKPTDGATPDKVASDQDAQPRGEDGKFKKAGDDNAAGQEEPDDDVKLTRKIEKLINKKHRLMKEAEEFGANEGRRAIAAERRVAELEAEIKSLRGGKADSSASGDGGGSDPDEPKPGDFKTVGDYTRALVKYEAKKAGEAGQAKADQERQQGEANATVEAFVKRQDDFRAATPDYDEVIEACDANYPVLINQYLVESESGPQLAYHLAKNPDEFTRLKKLSPSRLLAELGKLEAKLEKPAAPKPAAAATSEVSRAPAPIQPLEGKSAVIQKDPSKMNFQELRAYRQQEAAARAGR